MAHLQECHLIAVLGVEGFLSTCTFGKLWAIISMSVSSKQHSPETQGSLLLSSRTQIEMRGGAYYGEVCSYRFSGGICVGGAYFPKFPTLLASSQFLPSSSGLLCSRELGSSLTFCLCSWPDLRKGAGTTGFSCLSSEVAVDLKDPSALCSTTE